VRLSDRNLVTMDDFSNGEIESLFATADEMSAAMDEQLGLCHGKIMASLFFEPSTRTRLSFEAAMHRLGGGVISVADVKATSLAKGESIADMARIVGSYADIIVIRHPWEGAAKVVADYAGVPVINAGDGGHQHPTQTLCDLYTIKKERQKIRGLKIALWGDLKYGRTIHSLIFALAKFGAPFPLDAIYITPSSPHQLAMMPDINIEVELKTGVDAIYVTRPQKERFAEVEKGEGLEAKYPVVDKRLLRGREFKQTLVMHPLPRVDELAYEMDADPRSMYFKQAARGVPIRMALLALLLGVKEGPAPVEDDSFIHRVEYPVYRRDFAVRCDNPACVSMQESEVHYLKPEFKIVSREPLRLRCVYCEHGFEPGFVASSDWHQGMLEHKKYHRANSHLSKKIKPENLIIFDSESEARAHGFKPSQYAGTRGRSGDGGRTS